MKYTCPVCGFDQMPFPPEDYNICTCCGTEFGYDDHAHSPQQLRRKWIANGCPWFSAAINPQPDWNPYVQMLHGGLLDVTVGGSGDVLSISLEKMRHPQTASKDVGTVAA
jgi:hypothetical protein